VAMANMAINRAMTTGNILYMMALDMKDAFGSVSHKQLNNNLKSLGLCKPIREVIMDSYNGATVKVITLNGTTDNIHIKRGVKQGCPLSPVLFDICINPLIEKLNSKELKKFGYYWNDEDGVTAQAYADDILLFANSFESLQSLVEIVNDFNYHSNIQLNPKKCEILKVGKDRNEIFEIQDPISGERNSISCKDGTNVVRYLGIPLATKKIAKMKWCQNQLSKMHHKATKLSEAGLKITQLIAGIKTFVLPIAEFLLRHTCVSKTSLSRLDTYFRKLVNGAIGGIPLTKETFYLQAKDGGFG
jgi:hypothetical protein